MRSTFSLLVVLILLLPGCATMRGSRVDTGGMTAYDGVSVDYPGDAQALAASAAEEMAHRYPPARTTLTLIKTDSTFGQDLETALRGQGFPIAAPGASGVRVAYTLDVIREETPPTCYLRVQTSDGVAFGTLHALTGEPRQTKGENSLPESALSNSASAPEPHPLNDLPPAVATTPQPTPEMPSKLERKGATSRERNGISVRVTSSAAKIAKRNRISVDKFCRLNNVAPDAIIPAGRRVLLQEPHESWAGIMPLPEAARADSSSEVRQTKFTPSQATKDTPRAATILPAVAIKQPEAASIPAKTSFKVPADSLPAVPPAASSPVSRLIEVAAYSPVAPQAAPATAAAATPQQPTPLPGPAPLSPPAPSVPDRTTTQVTEPQSSGPGSAAPVAETPASPPPSPPTPPEPGWNVSPGSLHSQLGHWAMRAHYQLIWKAQHDFDLEARADFEGDFETAIKQLFAGLHRSGHALRVTLYRGNNVLEVAED
ncbi:toxin co-regulated pilus biosynthesis Q family protein [Solidesulfovibrio carbinolicus]|nr:toxin co-regulated pilus biosynthesis Q family protein [Solidesulfovibrio carbinolicus]